MGMLGVWRSAQRFGPLLSLATRSTVCPVPTGLARVTTASARVVAVPARVVTASARDATARIRFARRGRVRRPVRGAAVIRRQNLAFRLGPIGDTADGHLRWRYGRAWVRIAG